MLCSILKYDIGALEVGREVLTTVYDSLSTWGCTCGLVFVLCPF